ncbi:LGFP repeat-containing protein [Rhodococcus sp. (in: high G+C Gram-positive bacteria)]|uniref:LGFP repeat-containing protein n=1 Tax=Rhodococcus sp. TaxID=1831 RepID=UPI003BAF50C7
MTRIKSLRRRATRSASLVFLSLLLGVGGLITAPTASADGNYCGYWVLGAIEAKYLSKGGPGGVLGCPTTGELTNPDGYGKRNHFGPRGIIYWSGGTGAHPVWGAILDLYSAWGYEQGQYRYPTGDEAVYPDPLGPRYTQNFQCGRLQWQSGWPSTYYNCD